MTFSKWTKNKEVKEMIYKIPIKWSLYGKKKKRLASHHL